MPATALRIQDRLLEFETDHSTKVIPTAAYKMSPGDHALHIALTFTGNVTLPSVAEAKGQMYTVRVVAGGGGTVTIIDRGDVATAISRALSAVAHFSVLYSDGEFWYELMHSP